MRRVVTWLTGVPILLWALPALASEGPATALDYRAPTEGLAGASLLFVNLYNDKRLVFAIVCTAMMATCGLIIGITVDAILSSLGLKATKQGHRE